VRTQVSGAFAGRGGRGEGVQLKKGPSRKGRGMEQRGGERGKGRWEKILSTDGERTDKD